MQAARLALPECIGPSSFCYILQPVQGKLRKVLLLLLVQAIDPAVAARIEEAERIAAQAEAEAAAYAEHAANIQAEHTSRQQQQEQVYPHNPNTVTEA